MNVALDVVVVVAVGRGGICRGCGGTCRTTSGRGGTTLERAGILRSQKRARHKVGKTLELDNAMHITIVN